MRNKTRLRAEYTKLNIIAMKGGIKAVVEPFRYARVNTIKSSLDECTKSLKNYRLDEHIPDLLIFESGTDLTKTDLYQTGKIILQDKASCMPVVVLDAPAGSKIIDACAAPGNKTTQLAAIKDSQVFAFDRDPKRCRILEENLRKHTKGNVKVINCDFLKVDPSDYPDVEYILVDPSCSGSGILSDFEKNSLESLPKQPSTDSMNRLRSLANFQCMIIKHAMKFPLVKRIVYSTCSVNVEENEMVVQEILADKSWTLSPRPLPNWGRRGLDAFDFCDNVLRADPIADRMNGFFVACFQKKLGGNTTQDG
jgi:putative methyltransferase